MRGPLVSTNKTYHGSLGGWAGGGGEGVRVWDIQFICRTSHEKIKASESPPDILSMLIGLDLSRGTEIENHYLQVA